MKNYQHSVDLISLFHLLHLFLVLFVQLREMSSDELSKRAVVESEPPRQ